MNWLDYLVLVTTLAGIAAYGVWRTRGKRDLNAYLKGARNTPWFVIGLSVMATQASAITFLSTPGQGYESGLGFVQNYFGAPFALILIAAVFLPIYRRLNVYTAYEFLGKRFDQKTRLLGAGLFLLQRGIGAGITIYAPAIVLSTVMGWRLDLTIVCSGLLVIIYTVAGGSEAVSLTQKYQLTVIFAGMLTALVILVSKLPHGMTLTDALSVAGGFRKLEAVDFSVDLDKRYTFWSGLLGGFFLALSYFGTDQSQVQRYLSGSSVRESRLGLMFNAVCKIPMQFLILLLGVLIFVFYQFEKPPIFFNQTAWEHQSTLGDSAKFQALERDFEAAFLQKRQLVQQLIVARHSGYPETETSIKTSLQAAGKRLDDVRKEAKDAMGKGKSNDSDYVFITFIIHYLPHGVIGLLVCAFFAAALSSKAGELNALASTTIVDLYRHVIRTDMDDAHYVLASKCFTIFWGLVAIAFALFAQMTENLIQASNIVGSIFYGVVLGLFLIAFFIKHVAGTAAFWAALVAQALVLVLYIELTISYLWFNAIGCAACIVFGLLFQAVLDSTRPTPNPTA